MLYNIIMLKMYTPIYIYLYDTTVLDHDLYYWKQLLVFFVYLYIALVYNSNILDHYLMKIVRPHECRLGGPINVGHINPKLSFDMNATIKKAFNNLKE